MRTHTFKFDVKGSDVLNGISNAANSLGLVQEEGIEESRGKKSKFFLFFFYFLSEKKSERTHTNKIII